MRAAKRKKDERRRRRWGGEGGAVRTTTKLDDEDDDGCAGGGSWERSSGPLNVAFANYLSREERKKEIPFERRSCNTNYRNGKRKREENPEPASNLLLLRKERFFRRERRRIKLRVVATKNRRVDSQGFRVYEQRFPFPRPRNRIYAGKTRDRKGFARYPFNFRATFQFLPSTPPTTPPPRPRELIPASRAVPSLLGDQSTTRPFFGSNNIL